MRRRCWNAAVAYTYTQPGKAGQSPAAPPGGGFTPTRGRKLGVRSTKERDQTIPNWREPLRQCEGSFWRCE